MWSLRLTSNIDNYFNIIMPWVLGQAWVTRKSKDIFYWCLCTHIVFLGYHRSSQGRKVCAMLKSHINKHRYSNNVNYVTLNETLLINEVQLLFKESACTSNKITRGKAMETWVIEVHTKKIWSFKSMTGAAKFCETSDKRISNYRDTNRILKDRYLISSIFPEHENIEKR